MNLFTVRQGNSLRQGKIGLGDAEKISGLVILESRDTTIRIDGPRQPLVGIAHLHLQTGRIGNRDEAALGIVIGGGIAVTVYNRCLEALGVEDDYSTVLISTAVGSVIATDDA